MRRIATVLALVLFLPVCSGPALGELVEATATEDSWIYLGGGDTNYGGDDPLILNGWSSLYLRQALMKFDLTGLTAAPSMVVNSVELVLMTRAGVDWGGDLPAHCRGLDADWGEYTVTWNNCPSAATVISNTVTLKGKFADPWQQRTWTFNGDGRALVAAWMLGGANYGFKLQPIDPYTPSHEHQVHSRETTNPDERPKLLINFTPVYAPSTITDLSLKDADADRVEVEWTAPTDLIFGYDVGSYELRYSTSPIDAGNFDSATLASGVPVPADPGTLQSCVVAGLNPNTPYYFAIKSHGPYDNLVSDLSTVLEASTTAPDVVPPPAVDDLAEAGIESRRVTLSWSASSDDGDIGISLSLLTPFTMVMQGPNQPSEPGFDFDGDGDVDLVDYGRFAALCAYVPGPGEQRPASSYEVRYSTSPLSLGNFDSATLVAQGLSPKDPGQTETLTVTGLDPDSTYYFAVKVLDEVPNSWNISNVVQATTLPLDLTPPEAVDDLAGAADIFRVTLVWTAPVDDGGGAAGAYSYDIRYSQSSIDEGNWSAATPVADPPVPALAGQQESLVVEGLSANTEYYLAIKSADDADPPNVSALSNVLHLTTLPEKDPVVLINPWIVNDRVADCRSRTTMGQTFINSYTPDGVVPAASDEEAAINVYDNVKRRLYHWADEPPLMGDAVGNLNLFGWALCGRHVSIARTVVDCAGLSSRQIGLPGHWVYEVQYDGAWHLFDTMTTMYVFNNVNRTDVASAEQIKNNHSLLQNAVADGRACPGFLLCGDDPQWYVDALDSYSPGAPSSGCASGGHSMDMNLRMDETIERTWEAWAGHHPPIYTFGDPPYHHEAQHDWKDYVNWPYWEPYGLIDPYINATKTTYRRWANGSVSLSPDFRTAGYQASTVSSSNVATFYDDGLTPDLHLASLSGPAEIVFEISSPFWLTGGQIDGTFYRNDEGDRVQLYVSTDGTSWTDAWSHSGTGTVQVSGLNVSSTIYDNYSMFVRVLLEAGGSITDAGVSDLTITAFFEHNKGGMAYLDKGVNQITVTADNPQDLTEGASFLVRYEWKEYDGANWTIARQDEQLIDAIPTTYSINVGGSKVPRTESIAMELVAPIPPCVVPPLAIGDLTALNPDDRSIDLTWTAPMAGCPQSRIASYDIRYSTSPIDAGNWIAATPMASPPEPQAAGMTEYVTVDGLDPETTYYFAIKSEDSDANVSPLSNVASQTTTSQDLTPPADITDLLAITSPSISGGVDLAWTAPGDDGFGGGPAAAYDIRYAMSAILTEGDFAAATQVAGVPAPGTPLSLEQLTVGGLTGGLRYYFAIKTFDNSSPPNVSGLSNSPSAVASNIGTLELQNGVDGYTGCSDTFMRYQEPDRNFGANSDVIICGYATPQEQRTLIYFDVSYAATGIEQGTPITEATLKLWSHTKHGSSLPDHAIHNVTRAWNENEATWNNYSSAGGWTSPGGDYDPTPITTFTPTEQTKVDAWYEWDVTDVVQDWIDNPSGNNGWLLKLVNEDISSQTNFHSSDWADSGLRPMLVISDEVDADAVAPEAITDVAASNPDSNAVDLSWTAPIDENDVGQQRAAAAYDIRYSTSQILDDTDFANATPVASPPSPASPGTPELFTVSGLQPLTLYYLAIKSSDANLNVSDLSNVVSDTTGAPDITAPAAITDLTAATGTGAGEVDLTWIAPGDDDWAGGPASSYDVRYSTTAILDDTDFAAATLVSGEPAPGTPLSAELFTVTGLISGQEYCFAIKTSDEVPNVSTLSNSHCAEPPAAPPIVLQNGLSGYSGCTDSYLRVNAPTTNYGTYERVVVTGYGSPEYQRTLIRFDLSSVPPGTPVASATLMLYTWNKQGGGTPPYGLYELTRDWNENEVTWNNATSGITWTTAGGDYDPTVVDTFTPTVAIDVWHDWDVTTLVQQWLATPSSNLGVLIKLVDEELNSENRYNSSDYAADESLRPKLVISSGQ